MPETSARIAILGAGPIGLETALYARYLGYPVQLFERGESATANVLAWGHVHLFTPARMNISPLGVAALQAQDPKWQCPIPEGLLPSLLETAGRERSTRRSIAVQHRGRRHWARRLVEKRRCRE